MIRDTGTSDSIPEARIRDMLPSLIRAYAAQGHGHFRNRSAFSYGSRPRANSPYIFDASVDNFPHLAPENFAMGPVRVNYWWSVHDADAAPCAPRRRVQRAFSACHLNTDEFAQLARCHGVVSLPIIKVYRDGKVVNTLHGAESEAVLRDFIRKQVGDTPPVAELEKAIAANPDNLEARYRLSAVEPW